MACNTHGNRAFCLLSCIHASLRTFGSILHGTQSRHRIIRTYAYDGRVRIRSNQRHKTSSFANESMYHTAKSIKIQNTDCKTPRLLQPRKRHGTHRPLPLRFDELPSFQRNIRTADTAFQTERNKIENRPLVKRERNTGV